MLIVCVVCVVVGMILEHKLQVGNRLLAIKASIKNSQDK